MRPDWGSITRAMALYALFILTALSSSPGAAAQQSGATTAGGEQAEPPTAAPVLHSRPIPGAEAQPSPIAKAGSIHLDVSVSDAAGRPVLGLEPSDFILLDNNQSRKILSFRSFDGVAVMPDPPVQVILLIDTVNLPFEQVAFTRQEIGKFLRQNEGHLAQPVSLMLLTESGLRVQPRASVDGNALVSVVNQIKGGIHTISAAMGTEGDVERFQLSLRQMATIAENEARRPGRKLLIWVGPGWPMLDSRSFTFSEKEQRRYFDAIVQLSNALREARMPVYSVSAPEPGNGNGPDRRFLYEDYLKGVPSASKADTGDLALKVLVSRSGGRILGPDNELAAQIDRCIQDADAFYSISFNPPKAEHPDEYHDLKIEIDRPGVVVRTTSGYYNQPANQ